MNKMIWAIIALSYIYSSVYRRKIKRKFMLIGLVNDHHIIPRQFRNDINYNNSQLIDSIDSSKNLIILPTYYGNLFINTTRPVHTNNHRYYNEYVKSLIDKKYEPDAILLYLRYQLIHDHNIRVLR